MGRWLFKLTNQYAVLLYNAFEKEQHTLIVKKQTGVLSSESTYTGYLAEEIITKATLHGNFLVSLDSQKHSTHLGGNIDLLLLKGVTMWKIWALGGQLTLLFAYNATKILL